jgi:hypothetical protein
MLSVEGGSEFKFPCVSEVSAKLLPPNIFRATKIVKIMTFHVQDKLSFKRKKFRVISSIKKTKNKNDYACGGLDVFCYFVVYTYINMGCLKRQIRPTVLTDRKCAKWNSPN